MSNNMTTTQERKVQALTLRLPPDVHDQLRTFAFYTRRSVNELMTELAREFLTGRGRDELMAAVADRGRAEHREALDKLA